MRSTKQMAGKAVVWCSTTSCWGLTLFITIIFSSIYVTKSVKLNAIFSLVTKGIEIYQLRQT